MARGKGEDSLHSTVVSSLFQRKLVTFIVLSKYCKAREYWSNTKQVMNIWSESKSMIHNVI